jgi:hypothetical protein
MAGRAATPQGRKLNNINNMPDRKYLPSINFLYLLQSKTPFIFYFKSFISLSGVLPTFYFRLSPFLTILPPPSLYFYLFPLFQLLHISLFFLFLFSLYFIFFSIIFILSALFLLFLSSPLSLPLIPFLLL